MRYCDNVFIQIMKRLKEFSCIYTVIKRRIKERYSDVVKEWNEIQMFIMWEYSNGHLNVSDKYCCHCCLYSLGGQCSHTHSRYSCSNCIKCFTFLDDTVVTFLNDIKSHIVSEYEIKELDYIIQSLPKFRNSITHYMAHRLRSKVQFISI